MRPTARYECEARAVRSAAANPSAVGPTRRYPRPPENLPPWCWDVGDDPLQQTMLGSMPANATMSRAALTVVRFQGLWMGDYEHKMTRQSLGASLLASNS